MTNEIERKNAQIIYDELSERVQGFLESNYPEAKDEEARFEIFFKLLPEYEPWLDLTKEPSAEDIETIQDNICGESWGKRIIEFDISKTQWIARYFISSLGHWQISVADASKSSEIIGNIFENPELIKE